MDIEKEAKIPDRKFEAEIQKQWDAIGIDNDFIFGKVMQDKELLKELVRMILPNLEFTDLEIEAQKSIEHGMDIHGVRFDIFVTTEEGETVEIEMQVIDTGNLPKRLRYYGASADVSMLEKGLAYSKLRDSYVILICSSFDPYGEGLHRYTFTNKCTEKPELEMGDGTTKIVLSAIGTADDVNGKLKAFLDYVAGMPSDDDYVKKLDEAVRKARQNKEWRREYMTLMQRDLENQEIGMKKGEKAGESKLGKLIAELLALGRTDDAQKAATDEAARNIFYKEFHIM